MNQRSAFTLVEIMISIMIFTVVSTAMVGIMMVAANLFRAGEFSRSANDETVAVIGAIDDDLKHVVPSTGDGYVFSRVTSVSGNTLIAFTTKQEAPDGVTARGLKSQNLVALWVEENQDAPPDPTKDRLRRVELDDTREIGDFITSLMVTAGFSGQRLTSWKSLSVDSLDDEGNTKENVVSFAINNMAEDLVWPARRIVRAITSKTRSLRFTLGLPYTVEYTKRAATGIPPNPTEPLVVDVPASTLTQGCLHFSVWLALQDLQDMKRPRDTLTHQPDWEQRTTDLSSTRLGPWTNEPYDTRPRGWTPQLPLNAAPFPTAVRFSLVLTGGGRFVPTGTLIDPLDSTGTVPVSFRVTGLKSVPTIPGSMIRVGDEWITYSGYVNGGIKVEVSPDHPEAKRGARRSTIAPHAQREQVWMGQAYSLVRSLPK